jgi:hypothetical protein
MLRAMTTRARESAAREVGRAAAGGEPAAAPPDRDLADHLGRLAQLRDQRLLTQEEYEAAKTRLLGPLTASTSGLDRSEPGKPISPAWGEPESPGPGPR